MSKVVFPEWAKILYRGVRAGVGAGIAQVVLLPDWQSQPERTLLLAFLAGFLPAFGKWGRDKADELFGWDEKSLFAKFLPI